jgi:hypothetical protein
MPRSYSCPAEQRLQLPLAHVHARISEPCLQKIVLFMLCSQLSCEQLLLVQLSTAAVQAASSSQLLLALLLLLLLLL